MDAISDVGFIKRTALAATKPDIIVDVNGENYTITTIATLKTLKVNFDLGKQFETDPGTDRICKVSDRFALNILIFKFSDFPAQFNNVSSCLDPFGACFTQQKEHKNFKAS
jgi:hypothetical protein